MHDADGLNGLGLYWQEDESYQMSISYDKFIDLVPLNSLALREPRQVTLSRPLEAHVPKNPYFDTKLTNSTSSLISLSLQ
jgi:hypothetical protein